MTNQKARNSKASPIIDVVLATTGKSFRLADVLHSILNQTYQIDSIYIIWNSLAEPVELKVFESNPRVNIIVKAEVNGAASAYNYGIKNSIKGGSSYICLAADDDIWELEKIAKQIKCVKETNVVFTSATFMNEYHTFKRPKVIFPKSTAPIEVFYTKKSILSYSKHYLPISSVMFPTIAAKHLFNEKLVVREDIEWLQRLHLNGFQILQLSDALINVGSDSAKASKREFISDIKMFLEIIVSETAKRHFLLYTLPRSSVLAGDLKKLSELHEFLKTAMSLNLRNKMELFIQVLVCFCIHKLSESRLTSKMLTTRERSK